MIRKIILLLILFSSVSWANDIYVEQTPEKPESVKPAFTEEKPKTSEKDLISPSQTEYCSVLAGCYEVK